MLKSVHSMPQKHLTVDNGPLVHEDEQTESHLQEDSLAKSVNCTQVVCGQHEANQNT